MKKYMQAAVAAVAMAVVSGGAFAADQGAFFINGNLGQSHFHDRGFNDRSDTSGALRAGYSWQGDTADFGIETGYVDLGKASGSVAIGTTAVGFSAKAKGPLLGVNGRYKFRNKMYISGRAGWFHTRMEMDAGGFGSGSYNGDGTYAGVGVGYDVTQHFSLGVGFDNYHGRIKFNGRKYGESIGVFSGFAEYRF